MDTRMSSHSIAKITRNPFPKEWRSTITWTPPLSFISPGTASGSFVVTLNDLWDPDVSNVLGNGQALYTDQLLSATGPYQKFRVNGWKSSIELINASPSTAGGSPMPLDIYIMQGASDSNDVDTFSELQSSPGVETSVLGPNPTALSQRTWYFNGKITDYVPEITAEDQNYTGTYSSSPASKIYMGVGYKNGDPSDGTAVKLYAKVKVEYDVTFFARDGVTS
jgi:hypothetical protein